MFRGSKKPFLTRLSALAFKRGGFVDPKDLPTVAEIVECINKMPGKVERCYYFPSPFVEEPVPEFWIKFLGVWVNENGHRYSGDRARGVVYTSPLNGWRLRRALKKWKKENEDA